MHADVILFPKSAASDSWCRIADSNPRCLKITVRSSLASRGCSVSASTTSADIERTSASRRPSLSVMAHCQMAHRSVQTCDKKFEFEAGLSVGQCRFEGRCRCNSLGRIEGKARCRLSVHSGWLANYHIEPSGSIKPCRMSAPLMPLFTS